ncbi:Aste57867_8912 [Aphanomyces stellatus]|uniref:Aste57867_8912 protein n=1 Tax=Aphanomyces stellatus TaxID=120398 RepID=A0A485KLN7_9STRA|nr:hypothetical protein As57867_008877 [Aphanomyces stellatus]VFT85796.1 Aste57867_8912 [Aphanomyces stellatus]
MRRGTSRVSPLGGQQSMHQLTRGGESLHAMLQTPSSSASSSARRKSPTHLPSQTFLHNMQSSVEDSAANDHLLRLKANDDDDDDDPHRRFFYLLKLRRLRTLAENADVHDCLARDYTAAYRALQGLSRGNAQHFRDLVCSLSVVAHPPQEFVVRQDATPAGSVFVVLAGECTETIRRHRFNLTTSPSKTGRRVPVSTDQAADDDLTWRTLHPGDLFGLESLYFQFPCHYISLRSDGCLERNAIGVSARTPTLLLVVPNYPRERINVTLCPFDAHAAAFLDQICLFHSLTRPYIEFLASHLTRVHVSKHEFLYTAGQPPSIYLVYSGEMRVYTVEDVVLASDCESEVVTRRVELQILKSHDVTGLAEVCLNSAGFQNYCVATLSTHVYILPTYALFAVVKPGMPVLHTFLDYFTRQRNWYKLRRFTALNHYNKRVDYRLTPSMQRKGPIACPRCGTAGHMSDSLFCEKVVQEDDDRILDDDGSPRRGSTTAGRRASTAPSDNHDGDKPISARSVFLQRRLSQSEREVMMAESALEDELSGATDGHASLEKVMRRMDRALGLHVKGMTFSSRNSRSKSRLRSHKLHGAPKQTTTTQPGPPQLAASDSSPQQLTATSSHPTSF